MWSPRTSVVEFLQERQRPDDGGAIERVVCDWVVRQPEHPEVLQPREVREL